MGVETSPGQEPNPGLAPSALPTADGARLVQPLWRDDCYVASRPDPTLHRPNGSVPGDSLFTCSILPPLEESVVFSPGLARAPNMSVSKNTQCHLERSLRKTMTTCFS